MKKLFIIFLLFISSFVFADDFTGIFGTSFGDSKYIVESKMLNKEWHKLSFVYDKKTSETWFNIDFDGEEFLIFGKEKGTFGNANVVFIAFDFKKGSLYKIRIFPDYKSDLDIMEQAVIKKYNFDKEKKNVYKTDNGNAFIKNYSPDFGYYYVFTNEYSKLQKAIDDL